MNITAFRDKAWEGAKYVSGGVYAMTNNLGFGGHNASLIVRKFEE